MINVLINIQVRFDHSWAWAILLADGEGRLGDGCRRNTSSHHVAWATGQGKDRRENTKKKTMG